MKRWLSEQIAGAFDAGSGTVVLLDPDDILSPTDCDDLATSVEVTRVSSWVELRRHWDLYVRRQVAPERSAVLVVDEDFEVPSDLPCDIERDSSMVVRIRWPVRTELRPLFLVADAMADALIDAARDFATPGQAVAAAYGVRPGVFNDEMEAVARLRRDPATPGELWDALTDVFTTQTAVQIAAGGGDLRPLQDAWASWLTHGANAPEARELESSPGPLLTLFSSGLLTPAPQLAAGLPGWVSVGTSAPDPDALIGELLNARPDDAKSASEWVETAFWWGQVRAAIAAVPTPPPSAEGAWEAWDRLDQQFLEWLRSGYGSSLLSASATPRAVHQIAPFLARRVDDGARVVLVVMDGMGFAQWDQLRSTTRLKILQSTGCLAMIPTLTSISRQAIFAGALPVDFGDTITTTSHEAKRWTAFWGEHGVPAADVGYAKTVGSDPSDVPVLHGRVFAVVVNAVDELLHGADVLGDRQVSAGVDLWARAGFLEALVDAASGLGCEVWVTADHGNLPTVAAPAPKEGQTVESAGTRVRLYPNEVLRDGAAEFGVVWDPPGYPRGTRCPLFAQGRTGFQQSGTRVSHGGLSLDEVIVPFMQVTT